MFPLSYLSQLTPRHQSDRSLLGPSAVLRAQRCIGLLSSPVLWSPSAIPIPNLSAILPQLPKRPGHRLSKPLHLSLPPFRPSSFQLSLGKHSKHMVYSQAVPLSQNFCSRKQLCQNSFIYKISKDRLHYSVFSHIRQESP